MTQTPMILENSLLPIKIGNRKYPTTEHYLLSSLLKDTSHQDILLSYPVGKASNVFNYYDQEQYLRVVYEACNKFHEKKCRSIQHQDDKTIGSLVRQLIKSYPDFLYKAKNSPLLSIVGLDDVENMLWGYNLVGHSLLRMKYILEKLPELPDPVSEYIFWKTHPENIIPIPNPKTYKVIVPSKHKQKKKHVDQEQQAEPISYFYETEPEADDHQEDEKDEQGFYPEEVPIYRNNRVRWIATNGNSRLDDLRGVNAQVDLLYATEVAPTNPFDVPSETDLFTRSMDPLFIFKIYKAVEHLVEWMKNGIDIGQFLHKTVDSILLECGVSFDVSQPSQRHTIYVEYWNQFLSKTIPYYHFIEKEILYPQNLAGFIRKEYTLDFNERIGQKIREILFSSFLYQVMEKSYPQVAPELRLIILKRERSQFTTLEYEEITDKLYQKFFQNKFHMDEEGRRRVMLLESNRLTTKQIEDALLFVPLKNVAIPSLDIHNTILDPMANVDIMIDDNLFHDLFQFIFYRLFIFYGDISTKEAYGYLWEKKKMIPGNDPRLSARLTFLMKERRNALDLKAIQTQYSQYPQIQEIWLYSKATNKPVPLMGEKAFWDKIFPVSSDLRLMEWVVSTIPKNDKLHFEKSIHLYFFLHDLVRSMRIMKSIVGKRLKGKSFDIFMKCFYHKLETIDNKIKVSKPTPQDFLSYMEKTDTITGASIHDLWRKLYPFLYLFQQDGFVPSLLFKEAKNEYPYTTKEDLTHALSRIVKCLYQGQEVPNDHFYLLTHIISGKDIISEKDELRLWPDPSFELELAVEEDGPHPLLSDLPEKIRKKLRRKPKKPKMEMVQYNIIHPSFEMDHKLLQEAFDSPVMRSRASYALAKMEKETIHPRRIVFFL